MKASCRFFVSFLLGMTVGVAACCLTYGCKAVRPYWWDWQEPHAKQAVRLAMEDGNFPTHGGWPIPRPLPPHDYQDMDDDSPVEMPR